ncbi:phosphonopyruvate decarboxylase [Harryflintia acetispora]|uniref:phosphonopyruvate decarboxylase n=1 Tax=Harryflintia acetispora TaxID=1849041 RepID=UPI001A9B8B01|nr:phosphonopyruvate decarboxylase [Harryflintia acetispora]
MIQVSHFIEILGSKFFVGVPDSQLQALCNYLYDTYGTGVNHIIAANEGNCTAIAAGYHLATGKVPMVYMQNSGIGNALNPIVSLLNPKVYGIPCIFVVGWRGEPGVRDEPQHVYQGEITISLLKEIGIPSIVLEENTSEKTFAEQFADLKPALSNGNSVAIVIKKAVLHYEKSVLYKNDYTFCREEALKRIACVCANDVIVSTTGKTSRELWELRENMGSGHERDFLTVGSMGHASSIALGLALHTPNKRVWCIDGDGALLMHMGSMAVIGQYSPHNLIHIVINNGAHESVGGMPTVAAPLHLDEIASSMGYSYAVSTDSSAGLDRILKEVVQREELRFVEIKAAIASRKDLGRPTIPPSENKSNFMAFIGE